MEKTEEIVDQKIDNSARKKPPTRAVSVKSNEQGIKVTVGLIPENCKEKDTDSYLILGAAPEIENPASQVSEEQIQRIESKINELQKQTFQNHVQGGGIGNFDVFAKHSERERHDSLISNNENVTLRERSDFSLLLPNNGEGSQSNLQYSLNHEIQSPMMQIRPGPTVVHMNNPNNGEVICKSISLQAPSYSNMSERPFKQSGEYEETSELGQRSHFHKLHCRQMHTSVAPSSNRQGPSSSKASFSASKQRQHLHDASKRSNQPTNFSQYMDDLVQVFDGENYDAHQKGSQVLSGHHQLEPRVVSLRLEPRAVVQQQSNQQQAGNSLCSSIENFHEIDLDSVARHQNSWKPGRVLQKSNQCRSQSSATSSLRGFNSNYQTKEKSRGSTISGVKLALRPQPVDLKKQLLSRKFSKQKNQVQTNKQEFSQQTHPNQSKEDMAIGCQVDLDMVENSIEASPGRIDEPQHRGSLYRKDAEVIAEMIDQSNFNYTQQQIQTNMPEHAPQEVSVFAQQSKFQPVASEVCIGQQHPRSTIVSLLRKQNQKSAAHIQSTGTKSLIKVLNNQDQNSQESQLLERPNINKLAAYPTKSHQQLNNQTQPQLQTTHSVLQQQTEQFLLTNGKNSCSSNGSAGRSASGRTPSPLKSMAELIRQTREQLRHLTPEMINAQVAQLLRQNQRVIQSQSFTQMANDHRRRSKDRFIGLKRINVARRASADDQNSEYSRPDTVLSNGRQNNNNRRRKVSVKRFVPLNTVQIRAYEFKNLQVTGNNPSHHQNIGQIPLIQKQQNKDIISSQSRASELQQALPQKPPELVYRRSNYSSNQLMESDYMGDPTLSRLETLYLDRGNSLIIDGDQRDFQIPRVSTLMSPRQDQSQLRRRKSQITQISKKKSTLVAVPSSGGLIVNRNQHLLSDSKESIEDDMFTLVRLHAKNNTQVRMEQQKPNDEYVQEQQLGEESDNTLRLTTQQDSSLILMQKSKDTMVSPELKKKINLRKQQTLQGGVHSLIQSLYGTKRDQSQVSGRAHSQLQNDSKNRLPYLDDGDQLSPLKQSQGHCHTFNEQDKHLDNSIMQRQHLAVKVDESRHQEIINTQQSEEDDQSSPSNRSGLRHNSRTVYSKKRPQKNEEGSPNGNSPQSRRSVFQRSVSKEVSPSGRFRERGNNAAAIHKELSDILDDTAQLYHKGNQNLKHKKPQSINLNYHGKIQVLKRSLKSQAQLDDLRFQKNIRTIQARQASLNAPQILDEQRRYLETFNQRETRNLSDEPIGRNNYDSNKSSPTVHQNRLKLISQQRNKRLTMSKNSDVNVGPHIDLCQSAQHVIESGRQASYIDTNRQDQITFDGNISAPKVAKPRPEVTPRVKQYVDEYQISQVPASSTDQMDPLINNHSLYGASKISSTQPNNTVQGTPERKNLDIGGVASIRTRASVDSRPVQVYSFFRNDVAQREPDVISNKSIVAKKSNQEMQRLMRHGAKTGSVQRTIQMTNLLGRIKAKQDDSKVIGKGYSIDRHTSSIGTINEPQIQNKMATTFSHFYNSKRRESYPCMTTMSVEAISSSTQNKSMETLQYDSIRQASPASSQLRWMPQQQQEKLLNPRLIANDKKRIVVKAQPQIRLNRHQSKQMLIHSNRRMRSTMAMFQQANSRQLNSISLLQPKPNRQISHASHYKTQSNMPLQSEEEQIQSGKHRSVMVGSDGPEDIAPSKMAYQSLGVSSVTSKSPGEPRKHIQHDNITSLGVRDVSQAEQSRPSLKLSGLEQHEDTVMTTRNSDTNPVACASSHHLDHLLLVLNETVPKNRIEQHFAIKRARKAHAQGIQSNDPNSDLQCMLDDQYKPIITGQSTFNFPTKAPFRKIAPRGKASKRKGGSSRRQGHSPHSNGKNQNGTKVVVAVHKPIQMQQSMATLIDSETCTVVEKNQDSAKLDHLISEPGSGMIPIKNLRLNQQQNLSSSRVNLPDNIFPEEPQMQKHSVMPNSVDLRPVTDHQHRRSLDLLKERNNTSQDDEVHSETSQQRTATMQTHNSKAQVVVLASKLAPGAELTPEKV